MTERDPHYTELLPLGPDETEYRLVTTEGVAHGRHAARDVPAVERRGDHDG